MLVSSLYILGTQYPKLLIRLAHFNPRSMYPKDHLYRRESRVIDFLAPETIQFSSFFLLIFMDIEHATHTT
jgi:hypothetical protein